jgi:serine/threonine-protein kinase
MKEVRGVTLAQVLDEAHRDPLGATRWSEQRRLELFQKVCAAVAYAHARGVAHCDLKPANVMVGAFGEVQVMDWGVARLVGASGTTSSDEPPVSLEGLAAVQSIVAGTPAYMAPEQALGLGELIGPASDVYALGVMLFEVLAGERPYRGTARELVQQAQSGPVPPLPRRPASVADDALYAIITRAMAADPAERFADAKAMDAELSRWREGAMRREKAAAIVAQARTMAVTIEPTFARAAELREQAIAALDRLDPEAPVEAKEPIWTVLDEASERARTATLRQVQAEQLLVQALGQSPELDEAKALIASMRHGRHVDAERRRAWDEAARHELVLRQYDTGAFRDYLEGRAPLTVATQPRCRAKLYRVVERARRLVTELVRDLGTTPITNVELPVGSYLLELLSSDRPPVFYPIVLRRRGAWPGVRPGDSTPFPVRLPEEGAVASGEIYVPAGCAELGGDDDARNGRPAERAWVDGFVVQEHPVTYADLGVFLASPTGEPYRRGVFRDGATVWRHDWPAVGVSWDAARAYAAWLARETGKPWRLPTEIEWEKAARGVDGRFYPWGDFADAVFSHSRTQGRIPASPTSIHAFDLDRSPYGGRGFGGNVRDWCVDAAKGPLSVVDGCAVAPPLAPDAVERIVRGGSFRLPPEGARVAARSALVAAIGHADVGIRLVRSW